MAQLSPLASQSVADPPIGGSFLHFSIHDEPVRTVLLIDKSLNCWRACLGGLTGPDELVAGPSRGSKFAGTSEIVEYKSHELLLPRIELPIFR
mgnify:CR=1 FL=1